MLSNNLPEDLMEEIMVRLPVKSLLRFKCVAKSWYALITEHSFITKQFERYDYIHKNRRLMLVFEAFPTVKILPFVSVVDTLKQPHETRNIELPLPEKNLGIMIVFGQCNGIFCICGYYPGVQRLLLWNPATKEVKDILSTKMEHKGMELYGFGFDSITKDFKVVTFPTLNREDEEHHSKIFNLSTNSWRRLDADFSSFKSCYSSSVGPYLNGAYHWYNANGPNKNNKFITRFDFSKETFGIIPSPPGSTISSSEFEHNHIAAVDESLAWIFMHVLTEVCLEIWVMKEYGIKSSWTKKFEIRPSPPCSYCLYPFHVFRDNGLFVYDDINRQYIAYDLRNHTREVFQDRHYRMDYMESLFPLRGKENTQKYDK